MRQFGTSVAVGVAAVLAIALFTDTMREGMPFGGDERDPAFRHLVPTREISATTATQGGLRSPDANDRRSLVQFLRNGTGGVRPVSLGRQRSLTPRSGADLQINGWTGNAARDLETITGLRERIEWLENNLRRRERELNMLNARLDTLRGNGIDLRESR
jgi:hypothetical protein